MFVLAHRKGGYRPGAAAPRTWLGSLAIRVVSGRRRALARRPASTPLVEAIPDRARGPSDAVEARKALARVQLALDKLSADQRVAFILYEIEGESCESIAAMLGVPVGTVYSRLFKARKRFQEAYARTTAGHPHRKSER